jgi:hypothetical protein
MMDFADANVDSLEIMVRRDAVKVKSSWKVEM